MRLAVAESCVGAHWHVIELRRARGDPAPAGISRTFDRADYQNQWVLHFVSELKP
jgi:hypothetical protein